ncbi:hypothetical protein GCK72_018952 [Caenorhabditis remanei]|uniref:PDZ domain-containing protein n=2 Tax=Caenorhabditis remanei TaxID=31234 RepID=E3M040_CAERE|nr:hypothetical protein GCK72_018952 [Caenorhabditis remanei]EFO87967.1 hypothetical protein CRE_05582 [Caenorhabditis remanei]KAF1752397.1 hypothetical protein GCK72_018952 [Caenorhabditis remanei]
MSAESLNLSREKRRAFRAGKFPEDIIKKDMIQETTYIVDCAAGTPNYKDFKVTEGMLLTKVPNDMTPPLEYCDLLLKINGTTVTCKREMQEAFWRLAKSQKPHYLSLTIRRIISVTRIEDRNVPANASIKKPDRTDPKDDSIKPNRGYLYFKVVLIYFPRSKLGINVKSYGDVVYVESTDNSWGSTTRRFLYLGDAILKIDDIEISDVKTTQTAIRKGFQKNGIVTMIIERATDKLSSSFVRNVINFSKVDPFIPRDVVLTCTEQLARYEKEGFPEPVPIFRGYVKVYKTGRVSVTETIELKNIRGDLLFPGSLMKVAEIDEKGRD